MRILFLLSLFFRHSGFCVAKCFVLSFRFLRSEVFCVVIPVFAQAKDRNLKGFPSLRFLHAQE